MRGGVCVQEDSTRSHRLVNCTCSPRPPHCLLACWSTDTTAGSSIHMSVQFSAMRRMHDACLLAEVLARAS